MARVRPSAAPGEAGLGGDPIQIALGFGDVGIGQVLDQDKAIRATALEALEKRDLVAESLAEETFSEAERQGILVGQVLRVGADRARAKQVKHPVDQRRRVV